ncbi:MAG: zinc ribbon domain-containing protein [Promethearchaeia archaeon]
MKYEKNQYSEGFNICGLIIAGAFMFWGISTLREGLYGFNWIGFLWLSIGIAILTGQIRALTNKSKIRNIVKTEFEEDPNASIKEVSTKTGISKKDVHAAIFDLKANGELKGKFSSKTGKLKKEPKKEEVKIEESQPKYCPRCGTLLKKQDAKFCEFCGASID